jgi:DNA repair protein RecO (recombination protein O)
VPTEKAQALVIRLVDFSETSRVVTFYTREFGKVGALAKGARRTRGPFAGALDLLCVCRIVLIRKLSGSLDLLTEAELVKTFSPGKRNSLQVLYAGYYVAELLLELTDENDPHPQLFDIAVESLRELESSTSVRSVVRHFEVATLRETGHMPFLGGCVSCGKVYTEPSAAWFSVAAGGLVCRTCVKAAGGTVRLSPGTVNTLQLLGDASNEQWRRLQLQAGMDREISAVTRVAITHLVGRKLKTAEFLGESPP